VNEPVSGSCVEFPYTNAVVVTALVSCKSSSRKSCTRSGTSNVVTTSPAGIGVVLVSEKALLDVLSLSGAGKLESAAVGVSRVAGALVCAETGNVSLATV
jgi:hypothetical protein